MSDADTLRELRKISKILLLVNAQLVEKEIGRIASTNDRKKMWVLIDGKRSSKDIADLVGVTPRGVNIFLREARLAGFIDYVEEHPMKILDYVPAAWIALVPSEEEAGKGEQGIVAGETLDMAPSKQENVS
ncbi:MAG: hypothetical protein JRN34_04990 [Nitrososphaerota archaeon]|jgi:hypothetical protein|nr:hypothetical protein [Nitrososphaerota archaeon]MDG6942264.1 hypothetical protein [Nitrososphaerota archaeon]MDG6942729.1 hypothetical protein [Nitrososphaerota archaeon]MDG6948516.1 hypothetical protein [Nitrososphaerota archaeon]MDG6950442.1 hypothetical protein [Nitrososphaerota archaeon]